MNRLIEFFARQRIFGDLLTVFVILVGMGSLLLTQREVFPNVNFDIITISTIFPGSSPEEVEKLVTNPIEQELKEVDGIKKMNSVSEEGLSEIVLQLDPDQTTEQKAKDDIQSVIDRLNHFPEDAERPVVVAVQSKQSPIIEIALSSNSDLSEMDLRIVARKLEKKLESIPGVARVVPKGLRDLEIQVEAHSSLLSRFRISLDDLITSLKSQNVSIPAGSIDGGAEPERLVRTTGEYRSPEDVASTVIRANDVGEPLRLRQVAKVNYDLRKATVLNRTDGKSSISLTVLKKEKADAIELVRQVRLLAVDQIQKIDSRVNISFVNDLSEFIERRLSILSGNLLVGLILVLFILSLILPVKVAFLVSLGIPFAFLGTMIVFYSSDISINLISILGLIIVSGMLVDDAIVVTDNAVRLMEEGEDPMTAAIRGTQQIWPSVVASVLTTVVAFLPMMFMTGIFGKFVKYIPIGVIFALIISLFEAFFILPGHIAAYIQVRKKVQAGIESPVKAGHRGIVARFLESTTQYWDHRVVPNYTRILEKFIDYRYRVSMGLVVMFLSILILAGTGMRFILFPPEGVEIFFIRLESPDGSSLAQTSENVRPYEQMISELPTNEWQNYVTTVGIQQQDENDPDVKRGTEYAQIAVFLSPEQSRTRSAQEIMDSLRAKSSNTKKLRRLTFERVNPGPPVGKPVSIGLQGEDFDTILPAVTDIKKRLAGISGVFDIVDSYSAGKEELRIAVKAAEASAAGLSVAQIGTTVRAAFEGVVATSIQKLDEEVDIRVSLSESERRQSASIDRILIPNRMGQLIPLSQVAQVSLTRGISKYRHQANRREVRVFADVDVTRTSATAVASTIRSSLVEFAKLHPNVEVNFGGEDEDTQESMKSLVRAFIVAGLGIFLILVMTFQQLLQPLLVLLTIPLGIMSVIVTLFVHRMPLSFMAMLGIIALAGVIVNNAIIFIDFINQNRAAGMNPRDSILGAAKMRVRPIFLTTITTVFGLLPTAYGIGGLDKFVVPIAMSLGWGLLFGSLLTAFVIPVAVSIVDDIQGMRILKRLMR